MSPAARCCRNLSHSSILSRGILEEQNQKISLWAYVGDFGKALEDCQHSCYLVCVFSAEWRNYKHNGSETKPWVTGGDTSGRSLRGGEVFPSSRLLTGGVPQLPIADWGGGGGCSPQPIAAAGKIASSKTRSAGNKHECVSGISLRGVMNNFRGCTCTCMYPLCITNELSCPLQLCHLARVGDFYVGTGEGLGVALSEMHGLSVLKNTPGRAAHGLRSCKGASRGLVG